MENWLLVAISGVTCGGKTSLTKKLAETLPLQVEVLCQDDYFLPENSSKHVIIPELKHANWDIVSSVKFEKLLRDVKNIVATTPERVPGILLLDGNLILNFRPIEQICNKKFYIVLNKEECWTRRRIRSYDPPDPPGFFEKCVWPMHQMYRAEIDENVRDVESIDGCETPEEIYSKVYKNILFSVQQNVNKS